MIGSDWGDDSCKKPTARPDSGKRRVAIVTGTRAEFGLLRPVMHAVRSHPELELAVIASGCHLVMPAETYREIKREFDVADSIPMQVAGRFGRWEDVQSLGRGVARFGRSFELLRPDWVVVLGDRIEAFAAATAASVGGLAVAHLHGGDRAEGVADEAMRHAVTKLAHLHLPATVQSAERIERLGEPRAFIRVVGSPAIDGLEAIPAMSSEAFKRLGSPQAVFLMHPIGREAEREEHAASTILASLREICPRVLAMHPNLDPGREGIVRAIEASGSASLKHLPRDEWVGLLKRLSDTGGALVGNSSAGLIEAAALRVPTVNIGRRQGGRESGTNVIACESEQPEAVVDAMRRAQALRREAITHPFGVGHAGQRSASAIAGTDPHDPVMLRKRCTH